jgi:hypothetical protein
VLAKGPILAGNHNQHTTSLDSGLGSFLTEDNPREAFFYGSDLTSTSREERDKLDEDSLQEEEHGMCLSLHPTIEDLQYQVKKKP